MFTQQAPRKYPLNYYQTPELTPELFDILNKIFGKSGTQQYEFTKIIVCEEEKTVFSQQQNPTNVGIPSG